MDNYSQFSINGNQETRSKSLSIFIIILIFTILVTGGSLMFYIDNSTLTELPEASIAITQTPTGIEKRKDLEGAVPTHFPPGLLLEKNTRVVGSYEEENKNTFTSSYTYISTYTYIEEYNLYQKYLLEQGYALTSQNQDVDVKSGVFEKPAIKIIISSTLFRNDLKAHTTITLIENQ